MPIIGPGPPSSSLYPAGGTFSIDGVLSDTWHLFIRDWQHSLIPTPLHHLKGVPGRSGKKNSHAGLSSRVVTLDLTFADKATIFADMRAFASAINPVSLGDPGASPFATADGSHQLIFIDDNPGFYLKVVPQGDVIVTSSAFYGEATIPFEAFDPFWYSTSSRSIAQAVASGGTIVVPNAGNVTTPPVITVAYPSGGTGALTGVVLTIGTVTLTYNGTIAAGQSVVFDCDKFTVLNNGVNDFANWSGDFPQIPSGGGVLGYSDTNHVGATVTVAYTDRWI